MKKKLIEVALPLEAINKASALEKSVRHGHPSTLHLWWARRPLAACRAVLFASLVDDPGDELERQRLFKLIEKLVDWENINNQPLLEQARAEILKSTGGNPPPIYDPFCGGGSIPLEAQRLGLEAHGSDLNPVAVLITKALTEIPRRFSGHAPVNREARNKLAASWPAARGLADDVRYYGNWMRDRAMERIGHLYPLVKLTDGSMANAVAWQWARTVTCPNPACGVMMPLVRSFLLSTKPGNETWVEPVLEPESRCVRFRVASGKGRPPDTPKVGRGARFRCLVCNQVAPEAYIKAQGATGRFEVKLMAIVADSALGRVFIDPDDEHVRVAESAVPAWAPDENMCTNPRWFSPPAFGMTKFADLFTGRQLVALTTFCDLVAEARDLAISDGASPDYADALSTYLAFGVDKMADTNSTLCSWQTDPPRLRATFARQALPMTWDFAEANIFGDAAGDFQRCILSIREVLERLTPLHDSYVQQLDATAVSMAALYSTDPPYYDNIGYADLSDYFYIWLRRSLASVYPDILSTVLVPKQQELVATPHRHGSKDRAQVFFEEGFGKVVARMRQNHDARYPLTIFYAFKQSESDDTAPNDRAPAIISTGWETMLEGLLKARFQIDGTWPMRSERTVRAVALSTNALASSIVLVCRPRPDSAPVTTRKDLLTALRRELPDALRALQQGNIAPVDLQQASIGPGMAVFSRYQKVLETDGTPMKVRTALALINQMLDEVLTEQESDFDPYTRFALFWFEQSQFEVGSFDDAEKVARAKAISVNGVAEAGIAFSKAGKVRLLKRSELPDAWNPTADGRLTVWEATQHLIRALDQSVDKAADLAGRLGGLAETARELAYRLYTICERKGWAEEAQAYNGLAVNWPDIRKQAEEFTLQ